MKFLPSTAPTVSVVMSVFNGERFLSEAIDSILKQSFSDFEFIIIDDGSFDRTATILQAHAEQDCRIRLCRQPNSGLIAALNRGCSLARGRLIARMDADDIAMPERIAIQVGFLERHPGVGVLGGAVEFINGDGKVLGKTMNPTSDNEIRKRLVDDCPFWHPTVVMRKEVLDRVGGYRRVFVDAEDCDLWLRMARVTKLANLTTTVVKYRFHPYQVTVQKCAQQALSSLAAHRSAESIEDGKDDPVETIAEITPETLLRIGVSRSKQQAAISSRYLWNVRSMFRAGQYSVALQMLEEVVKTSALLHADARLKSDLKLLAALIYFRVGSVRRSVLNASEAVLVRPLVIGRPLKLLWRSLRGIRSI